MIPSSIDQYIEVIESQKNLWNYQEAKKIAQEALIKNSDDYRLYEEMADIYLYENDIPHADEMIQIAQTLHNESATWTYLLGYIAIAKWSYQTGVDYLSRANVLFPNNPEILRNLGWGYVMLGDTSKWVAILRRALSFSPQDELIMEDLWVALMSNGNMEEGEKYLKQAGRQDRIMELRLLQWL